MDVEYEFLDYNNMAINLGINAYTAIHRKDETLNPYTSGYLIYDDIPTFHTSYYKPQSLLTISPWWEKRPLFDGSTTPVTDEINFDFQFTVRGTIKDYIPPVVFHDTSLHRFTCNCKDTFTEVYFWTFERENHDAIFIPNGKYRYDIGGMYTKLTDSCPVKFYAVDVNVHTDKPFARPLYNSANPSTIAL